VALAEASALVDLTPSSAAREQHEIKTPKTFFCGGLPKEDFSLVTSFRVEGREA
jgi:hypothetical protein